MAPVAVVEEDLLHEREDKDLQQHPVEGGQLPAHGAAAQQVQVGEPGHEGQPDHKVVPQDHPHRMLQLVHVHLHTATTHGNVHVHAIS